MGVVALIGVPLFARWRLMDTAAADAGPLADPAAQTGAGGDPPAGD
jgi:hypothetical protein